METEMPSNDFPTVDREALLAISSDDQARHAHMVARVRAKLLNGVARDFIHADRETIEGPCATYTCSPGRVVRTLRLGALRYRVDSHDTRVQLELEIRHCEGARFTVFLFVRAGTILPYTRFALDTEFQRLDQVVKDCIVAMHRGR